MYILAVLGAIIGSKLLIWYLAPKFLLNEK